MKAETKVCWLLIPFTHRVAGGNDHMLMAAEHIDGARLPRIAGHRCIEVAFKHKPGKWSSVVSH